MSLSPDFIHELQSRTTCEIRIDPSTRWLYSTDASIYQIEPLGVAFPRNLDDLTAVVALAAQYRIPILARGAGSSLAGQAIGAALILDCSRYLTAIHEYHVFRDKDRVVSGTVTAEPGIILNSLNRFVARDGLQFGPDPASAERATLGGSIANNATGAHSILYGMSADHLLSAEVILADGTVTNFNDHSLNGEEHIDPNNLEARLYTMAVHIREKYAGAIRSRWPRVWRRASGYNLNYLLPWTPSIPDGWQPAFNPKAIYNFIGKPDIGTSINLAPLLAGSEGTLAVIRQATLQLVPLPRYTILGVLAYNSLEEACDTVPGLLERHHPSAVELISRILIELARSVPAYASQLSWVDKVNTGNGDPAALLIVEFSGDDFTRIRRQVEALGSDVLVADTAAMQKQIWTVRKVGLGILQSRPGAMKPATFIEDLVVPVEHLGEYVREMERIMIDHNTTGDFYAHASAGCLHFRPILNIKTPQGIAEMRTIAEEAIDLVLRLGGAASGEHGDGISRSEWLERAYGAEIITAFRELKSAADPNGILNPGKIVASPRMDENLRMILRPELGWAPVMDFKRNGGAVGSEGLLGAIEMCNGAGVCRKAESVMCPSFQATQEEAFSTRGRANLLRSMMVVTSGVSPQSNVESADSPVELRKVWESLDLCLACKGCKSECPSGVDMAKLKYEFMHRYYTTHRRKLRDFLFGYIGVVAPLGAVFAPFVNWMMSWPLLRRWMETSFGLSCQRPFPRFSSRLSSTASHTQHFSSTGDPVAALFLRDTFNHYFYPEVEAAAMKVLSAAGVKVQVLPVMSTGRTLISKGFLPSAKKHAARLIESIHNVDPEGKLPIVGLEPSEMYTFHDEFLDFFPGESLVRDISERSWMIDEFLVRINHRFPTQTSPLGKVFIHGHCYQKTLSPAADGKPFGVGATSELLRSAGYTVEVIDDGCCGMAGAFGYESEHYDISMKVGGLVLFPILQAAKQSSDNVMVAAPGVSCRSQIEDGTGIAALHPIQLISKLV